MFNVTMTTTLQCHISYHKQFHAYVRLFYASAAAVGFPPNWKCQRNNTTNPWHPQAPVQLNKYASLLQACININSLKQVHAHILMIGFPQTVFFSTKLLSMYSTLGSMEDARKVFESITKPDTVTWNTLIKVYACKGFCVEALKLYYRMQREGKQPDNFTFTTVLKACTSQLALQQGV